MGWNASVVQIKKSGQSVLDKFPNKSIDFRRYFDSPNQVPHILVSMNISRGMGILHSNLIGSFDSVVTVSLIGEHPKQLVLHIVSFRKGI